MKPNPPRGPLIGPKWKDEVEPVVTVYKLITIEFKWLGLQVGLALKFVYWACLTRTCSLEGLKLTSLIALQGNVESFAINYEQTLFRHFHRKIFCTMDEWFGMTMEQVAQIEAVRREEVELVRSLLLAQATLLDFGPPANVTRAMLKIANFSGERTGGGDQAQVGGTA